MNTYVKIPERISAGFQNKNDTYTGKLAYVTYYDNNGELRKENSWNRWRDKEIEPLTFLNKPTSGFVLNKKVGEDAANFNYRNSHIRVYDPRGFEIEITVDNLLLILENTNCLKGKGLEGKFVYAWDNSSLMLLPTNLPEFNDILDYNELLSNPEKIEPDTLIPGRTYQKKDGGKYVFLEKAKFYQSGKRKGTKYYFAFLMESEYGNSFIITSMTDIKKKFIKTIDYDTNAYFQNMLYEMQMNYGYCPAKDYTPDIKCDYREYSYEEFVNLLKETQELIFYERYAWRYSAFRFTYEDGMLVCNGREYQVRDYWEDYSPAEQRLVDAKTNDVIIENYSGNLM